MFRSRQIGIDPDNERVHRVCVLHAGIAGKIPARASPWCCWVAVDRTRKAACALKRNTSRRQSVTDHQIAPPGGAPMAVRNHGDQNKQQRGAGLPQKKNAGLEARRVLPTRSRLTSRGEQLEAHHLPPGRIMQTARYRRVRLCGRRQRGTMSDLACQPCGVRNTLQAQPRAGVDQKLQRCALVTRKSRNTWMRATDLSSSG
jgi:hypothetical protein